MSWKVTKLRNKLEKFYLIFHHWNKMTSLHLTYKRSFSVQSIYFKVYYVHHLRLFFIGSLIESNGNQYFLLYYKSILFFGKFVALKKPLFFRVHLNKLFGPCSCHFDCIELYTTTPSGDISGHFKTFSCATLKLNMSRRGNL